MNDTTDVAAPAADTDSHVEARTGTAAEHPDLAPIAERAAAPAVLDPPPADLGLTWRPLAVEDASALTELVQVVEEADGQPFRTSTEEIQEELAADWRDLTRDTLVGLDAQGTMRAWAQVDSAPGDTRVVRAFVSGGVHPLWRGRGIGRAVVAWLQGRARQVLAASGKDVPGRIAAYLEDTAPASARVYRAAGFTPIRYYTEMRRSLRDPLPEVPLVEGIRVVPWSDELDDAVRLAHNESFADHWGSEPRTPEQWQGHRAMFAPTWSFVAVTDDGEVAGYATSGRYEHDWEVAGYSSGYTELLGVRRAWRGRGVAVALLATVMRAYAADGVDYAELGVDTANPSGAHGLYARLGYEVVHSSTMYSVEL
ncbi:GNAT family N-acetyltransferase [Cellulomonas shaoxiangyii]|uniref:GNAT family N-acetyltransferase n=1 Tax=Cellulomonas shaoxiangyii TaxID=2566013 RepID=A0A4P7SI55_9CELL|nr:GNAT family N-acetyltransferase [Cellulomonas shaoxiangyii]QCB93421.1 GNAT family N-acetyltransferase [Cellulomonas shaoxiangyii]TGY84658.1 GNAT family N-acetyltransferase [Cellulomonas shaoxiangyii]